VSLSMGRYKSLPKMSQKMCFIIAALASVVTFGVKMGMPVAWAGRSEGMLQLPCIRHGRGKPEAPDRGSAGGGKVPLWGGIRQQQGWPFGHLS